MFETLDLTRMARAMAAQAGARLGVIARNVAQADTPGYKAMDLPDFVASYQAASPQGMRATRPGHLAVASKMLEPVLEAERRAMAAGKRRGAGARRPEGWKMRGG